MSYRYLEDIALAEVAFEACGETREELFKACALAVLNVMVKDLNSIENKHQSVIDIEEEDLEGLLAQFLEEIIYYKDFYRLLLKPRTVQIEWEGEEERFFLFAYMEGETIVEQQHILNTGIKGVIADRLKSIQTPQGGGATVVFCIHY